MRRSTRPEDPKTSYGATTFHNDCLTAAPCFDCDGCPHDVVARRILACAKTRLHDLHPLEPSNAKCMDVREAAVQDVGGYGENYGQFTYVAHNLGFTRHDDDCILQMHCLHSDIFHMRTKIVPITSNYAPPIQGCNSGREANHGTGTCGIHRFQRGCARYIAVCERFFSPLLVEPAPQSGRKEYVPSVCCQRVRADQGTSSSSPFTTFSSGNTTQHPRPAACTSYCSPSATMDILE